MEASAPVLTNDDHAVIVGINDYPGLGELEGPENDAAHFREWLLSPAAGPLNLANVYLCVTSQFPPSSDTITAEPNVTTIDKAFRRIVAKGPDRVGRRLYIFLAGHGIARGIEDCLLLTAEADWDSLGFHIPSRQYANAFVQSGLFDEIVLIADCCREDYPNTPSREVPWQSARRPRAGIRRAIMLSARWGDVAREQLFSESNAVEGNFSRVLLLGLRGGAATETGEITTASLQNYVGYCLPRLTGNSDTEPHFEYNPAADIVFANAVAPLLAPVTIAADSWPPIEVLDSNNGLVEGTRISSGDWVGSLKPGIYRVRQTDGPRRERVFDVLDDRPVRFRIGESEYVDAV